MATRPGNAGSDGRCACSRIASGRIATVTGPGTAPARRRIATSPAALRTFAGELGRAGDNVCAPIAALYFLTKGPENKIESLDPADAGRALLENILFFAYDPEIVRSVFEAACEFVCRVPTRRLTFLPDARVWEMIA